MAYINYARNNYGKSSAVTSISKDINSIPWAKFLQEYVTAADEWEETALAAHERIHELAYEHMLSKKELAYAEANPESGAYEGNMGDEFPMSPVSPLPGKLIGRRKAGQKAIVHAIEALKLGDLSESIMPQIITKVGNMPTVLNDKGLISGSRFVVDNFKSDADRGMYLFLMLNIRSCYLTTQYKAPARSFSALVPLILYAQRLVKGTKYTAWARDEIHLVVNSDLADAMLFETTDWPSTEEILEGRTKGLTFATGKDAGKVRSALSSYRLYATTGTCYQGMPPCLQVMLAQIWVAHPDNRTKYMVLDPKQWDKVPPALIAQEVLYTPALTKETVYHSHDLPWNA